MNTQITLSDIKTTILNLKYKNINSPKYKFLNTLTQFFVNDISFSTINTIDSEILVKKIWNTGDNPRLIKAKLKNLNSVRSSINKDLNKLYKENQNPQGVNINTSNVFVMSNEAKNNLMDKFSDKMGSGSIDEIYNVLDLVNEIISKLDNNKINDSKNKLDKLRELINNISKDTPDNDKGTDTELIDDEDVEVVDDEGAELIDDDDIEVVDDVDTELIDDEDVEVVDDEGAELIDDEDIDVVDDEETELIDDDDVEVVDDVDTELIDDEDIEIVDDVDTELIDDDDVEVVDDDEDTDSKALAEEFDHELSIKERYYNQYILMDKDEYIIGSEIPDKNYLPLQKIRLDKFYIGKYPVTNALFETFIERTGYKTTAEKKGYGIVYSGRFKKSINEKTGQKESVWSSSYRQKTVEGACWYKPSGQNSTIHNKRDHPVVQISLKDAIAFCTWTGKKLPTEFEWEASARTKLGYMLPWGNTWKKDMCNIEESAFSDTTPVDKYSNIEIFSSISDSLGNVLEWTSDECISNYKTKRTFIYHIAKGGSWISQNNICLCSRFNIRTDLTSNILGFRCVIN